MTGAALLLLALRGAAAVAILVVLAGGLPRIVEAGLAIAAGLWCALVLGGTTAPGPSTFDLAWLAIAAREVVIGAALGIAAAIPLLAASAAGRIVDRASSARGPGPYRALFGVLAAAVFVGIDGHIAVVRAVATSYRAVPLVDAQPSVLAALGGLVPAAVHLAVPWLVTAAVVEIAAGVGLRLAGRAALHAPTAAAVPAALVMMTATLVGVLAVAIATLVRAAM
ncbi:MAG TPA: flagellar biosynthetic protein FliR [Kofleriaceae bacterium]|jgi:flagellar biosynthetic protein FliR